MSLGSSHQSPSTSSTRLPTANGHAPGSAHRVEGGGFDGFEGFSPRAGAASFVPSPTAIPIPFKPAPIITGPASEGAAPVTPLDAEPAPFGPSSAPPVPSVTAVTHPSPYVHTQLPRRSSIAPLAHHTISPVPPNLHGSPHRAVGFHPPSDYSPVAAPRRDSAHSISSVLSASRPLGVSSTPSHPALARRRSSLTPSVATLAPASPTRATASGRVSRQEAVRASGSPLGDRRSSLPGLGQGASLNYGGWAPPKPFAPTLPPQRGSMEAGAAIDEGFKFGSGIPAPRIEAGDAPMLYSERRLSLMPNKPVSEMDAFEQAEAEEAERQRRAFIAATYGGDGKRARDRLSIGGPHHVGSSTTSENRRKSLAIWEKLTPTGSQGSLPSSGPILPSSSSDSFAAERRGSLPIAIPGSELGRTPSHRSKHTEELHLDDDDDGDKGTPSSSDMPVRPYPPLMPLSDPGPRLLPGTLALHRATHALQYRGLDSEPMPAPLPSSLHPPAPVDFSEFDIDFILAGSKPNLGRDSKRSSLEPTPTNPQEEDSFAKFVGKFDDEYGDRRGEWTFRACPPRASDVFPIDEPTDPLDSTEAAVKAEWESPGAGKYTHYANGVIKAQQTARKYRIRKCGSREYELDEVDALKATVAAKPSSGDPWATTINTNGTYILTSKETHAENGGVKLPVSVQQEYIQQNRRISRRLPPVASGLIDETKALRKGSEDSSVTMMPTPRIVASEHPASPTPLATSLPVRPAMDAIGDDRGRVSFAIQDRSPLVKPPRSKSRSQGTPVSDDDKKKDKGITALKRGIVKIYKDYEERKERKAEKEFEKSQSQSWSGGSSASAHWSVAGARATYERDLGVRTYAGGEVGRLAPERSHSTSASSQLSATSASASASAPSTSSHAATEEDEEVFGTGIGIEDEQNNGNPFEAGKAWSVVPDDAVAMVIPCESGHPSSRPTSVLSTNAFFSVGPRQALLVWFVPFNADHEPSRTSLPSIDEQAATSLDDSAPVTPLGRLPKILRRRPSRDRDGLSGKFKSPLPAHLQPPDFEFCAAPSPPTTLPFRAFRIVAKIVDTDELRSKPSVRVLSPAQWAEQARSGKALPPSPESPLVDGVPNTGDVMAGRAFPTVLGVCHSKAQGVEFVLEGLDRLGLCVGDSAWGPTGYEEWRGTGLSEQGRELLDLLWAGCSVVLGL
ncbi:hypothetical protein Q5752_001698 [Cryptotrichosporon argae]